MALSLLENARERASNFSGTAARAANRLYFKFGDFSFKRGYSFWVLPDDFPRLGYKTAPISVLFSLEYEHYAPTSPTRPPSGIDGMSSSATILNRTARRATIYRKNQCIFRQGDEADAVWRVDRGCVRLQILREDGRREVFAFLFAGDLFPGISKAHWASAEAVVESAVSRIPKAALRELIGSDPEAAFSLLELADQNLLQLAQHLGRMGQTRAGDKVGLFLEWLADRTAPPGSMIAHVPMSRRDIADFLGLAPETVSRLLRRLETEGRVRRADRRRYLLTPRVLSRASAEGTPQAA